jgi:hypothetical protein
MIATREKEDETHGPPKCPRKFGLQNFLHCCLARMKEQATRTLLFHLNKISLVYACLLSGNAILPPLYIRLLLFSSCYIPVLCTIQIY